MNVYTFTITLNRFKPRFKPPSAETCHPWLPCITSHWVVVYVRMLLV